MGNPIADEPAPMADGTKTEPYASEHMVVAATEYHSPVMVAKAPSLSLRFKLDTASPRHATPSLQIFKHGLTFLVKGDMLPAFKGVGEGPPVEAQGFGPVEFEHFAVKKVYYAPGLRASILSVSELGEELDYSVEFTRKGYIIREASQAADDDDGSGSAAAEIVKAIAVADGSAAEIAKAICAADDDGSAAAGEFVRATCAADGSAAAGGKIVCKGTIDPDGYYTIAAKVDKMHF